MTASASVSYTHLDVYKRQGVTVVPQLSVPKETQPHIRYIRFTPPAPTRRVVLAWRRSFPRYEAIAALRNAIYACPLAGVQWLAS